MCLVITQYSFVLHFHKNINIFSPVNLAFVSLIHSFSNTDTKRVGKRVFIPGTFLAARTRKAVKTKLASVKTFVMSYRSS